MEKTEKSMKWIIYVLLTVIIITLFWVFLSPHGTMQKNKNKPQAMIITSTAFEHSASIPSQFTCDGLNHNPPLSFYNIPSKAKSLVLLMDDPDAPRGTWRHWSVYNMTPDIQGIQEHSKPSSGIEGITDFGTAGYGGPCPPSGVHHYRFKLYALDLMLELPEKATFNEIENAMQNHIISKAELVGTYTRPR